MLAATEAVLAAVLVATEAVLAAGEAEAEEAESGKGEADAGMPNNFHAFLPDSAAGSQPYLKNGFSFGNCSFSSHCGTFASSFSVAASTLLAGSFDCSNPCFVLM